MTFPLPENCRAVDLPSPGVAFTVELKGRVWQCVITREALADQYPGQDPIRVVSQSANLTRKVAKMIASGDDHEPILIVSTMFDEKGR